MYSGPKRFWWWVALVLLLILLAFILLTIQTWNENLIGNPAILNKGR